MYIYIYILQFYFSRMNILIEHQSVPSSTVTKGSDQLGIGSYARTCPLPCRLAVTPTTLCSYSVSLPSRASTTRFRSLDICSCSAGARLCAPSSSIIALAS